MLYDTQVRTSERGDTIVEVVIAAAVISVVLMGAFLVAQNSAKSVHSGQERSEATQLLQGQIEQTRQLVLADSSSITDPGNFCIDSSNPAAPVRVSSTDSACTQKNLYHISGSYDATTRTFVFTASWDRYGGSGTDKAQLSYRM